MASTSSAGSSPATSQVLIQAKTFDGECVFLPKKRKVTPKKDVGFIMDLPFSI